MPPAESFAAILQNYADALREAYRDLPPGAQEEAQLGTPITNFLGAASDALGHAAYTHGEVATPDVGRPDLGVSVRSLLTGYVEIKAPGKGARPQKFRGHDRDQWRQFQQLPNLIYTDGIEWGLYRLGELVGSVIQLGEIQEAGRRGLDEGAVPDLTNLLRDFLLWEPASPGNPKQLARLLAPLAHFLREQVLAAVQRDGSNLAELAREWREVLFSDADDAQFADGYAQTVTYALLLARLETGGRLDLNGAVGILSRRHALLGKALELLSVPEARNEIATGLNLLERVIGAIDPAALTRGDRDPWLYFYEDFLAEYDPKLRNDRGVYYTPAEVIQAQCALVEELLATRLGKTLGLADPHVTLLDPACGTGAYLVAALERGLDRVEVEEGSGNLAPRATQMGANAHGFEILVGPYTVAHLRLTQKLLKAGATLPEEGVHVYLTDTLESPHAQPRQASMLTRPLSEEHRRAQRIKRDVPVLVCLGNPPYDRQMIDPDDEATERKGGWVRWGETPREPEGGARVASEDAPLRDFLEPARASGQGVHLKNLYNDYVYFWRWALWKVFEQSPGPGIVTFITASSYLRGPGFVGVREWMRRQADAIWILDLEGDNLGARKTENVFDIQTPVAIAVLARFGAPNPAVPAEVRYLKFEGTREEKLARLARLGGFRDLEWREAYAGWQQPFLPQGQADYFAWPGMTDLFPWQHSGAQFKRTWPIGETEGVLRSRWSALARAMGDERTRLFRETRDRKLSGIYRDLRSQAPLEPLSGLKATSAVPPIRRYSYRSFDRQWAIVDARLGDFLRPILWRIHSDEQVYMTSLLTHVLGPGPASVLTGYLPDLDHFRGSFGAKHVIPLWRDHEATKPNVGAGLLELLARCYGIAVSPEDLFAFTYAQLANPAYVQHFSEELLLPGPRLPLTKDARLFRRGVELGRRLVALHTYGERWAPAEWSGRVPQGTAHSTRAIPATRAAYPEQFRYDLSARRLHIGEGVIEPVAPEIWEFAVSGYEVVQRWLAYRMKGGAGRASSPLDEIRPEVWTADMTRELLELLWVLEHTVALYPELEANLDTVLAGPLFRADELPVPSEAERKPPQRQPGEGEAPDASLFDEAE